MCEWLTIHEGCGYLAGECQIHEGQAQISERKPLLLPISQQLKVITSSKARLSAIAGKCLISWEVTVPNLEIKQFLTQEQRLLLAKALTLLPALSKVADGPSNCSIALPYSELLSCQQLICLCGKKKLKLEMVKCDHYPLTNLSEMSQLSAEIRIL